ncbi:methyl-accepting chemotaxis protein, partial [bacterium]|nr:methyl-accepting chemotaxis protein [bacterium]
MKIRTKLIVVNVLILVVTIGAVTAMCLRQFNQELRRQAISSQETRLKTFRNLLLQKGSEFRMAGGNLMIGNYTINGNYELPDLLKDLCGGTATIFMGDLRVSTNVLKDDGSRAIGTRLQGPAYD